MPPAKRTRIDQSRLGKEEINFPEFPLGIMSFQQPKELTDKLEFHDIINNEEIKVTILPSSFGFPNQNTRDLLRALMRITWRKNSFKSSRVNTSIREILRELGLSSSGQNLETVKKNLRILAGTRIEYEKSFFDKGLSDRIKTTFGINIISSFSFEEIESREQRSELKDNPKYTELLRSGISWNQEFFEISLKDGRNLIDFDYTYYITLENHISKELYLLLNKRSYNKALFKIDLNILAFEKLGLSRTLENKLFKVRQLLRKAHKELIDTGYLKKEPIFKKENGVEYVTYFFQTQALLFSENDDDSEDNSSLMGVDYEEIKARLLDIGFTEGETGKILKKYDSITINRTVRLCQKQKGVRNPKKWIFKALNDKYDTSEIETEELAEIEELKAKEQLLAQADLESQEKAQASMHEKLVDDWINNNQDSYLVMCEDELEKLSEGENPIYKLLLKTSTSKKIKPIETLATNRIFNSSIRAQISKQFVSK